MAMLVIVLCSHMHICTYAHMHISKHIQILSTYVHIYSSLTYSHTKLSLSCQEYCLNKEAWLIYICVHICEYAHSDLDLRIMCVCTWSTEHRVPSIFMLWVFLLSLILLWPTYLLKFLILAKSFWREALQFLWREARLRPLKFRICPGPNEAQ